MSPPALAALVAGGAAVVAVAGTLAFADLAHSVLSRGGAVSVDVRVHRWLVDRRAPWLTDLMKSITPLGGGVAVAAVVLVAVAVSIGRRRLGDAALIVASTAGTALLTAVAKSVVGRSRPVRAEMLMAAAGAAFPSGHAAQAVACYGALAVIVTRRSRNTALTAAAWAVAFAAAFAVGVSRVYLGVHWPSDVVAGWALGAVWLAVLITGVAGYEILRHRQRPSPGQNRRRRPRRNL